MVGRAALTHPTRRHDAPEVTHLDDPEHDRGARRPARRPPGAGGPGGGGGGPRLGFDGPKGTFPVGPLSGKSLFQVHAEKVLALGRRYGSPLPLYVMTGAENDAATRAYFEDHGHFGLDRGQVVF